MEYEDIVHGSMQIPKHIESIIQTPQFQRLKRIKQLGIGFKSLSIGNHNRYEHCIGTYFLANKMVDSLEKNTKDLKIPTFYRNAVTIAALLHDVGHGPFSHTWELVCGGQYNHEENANECINEIFDACLSDWMNDKSYAVELIKSFIVGDPGCIRDQNYRFLFEIVSNKQCNVDVDKWDYLKRDYFQLKDTLPPDVNLDFDDVFLEARASDDRAHIEYRYRDFHKIYNIFHTRATFHMQSYRTPSLVCLENIFRRILSKYYNDLESIDGIKIKDIRSKDKDAFLKLYDDEVWRIVKSLQASSSKEVVRLVTCLENAAIAQIFPITYEAQLAVPEYLRVKTKIANAGEEMKEENIFFYGDEKEKPEFEQTKGFFESISYFNIEN